METHSFRFTNDHCPGVSLHALAWGDADDPVVVLLHGGGANARWWDHVAPSLADRHRVIALDWRGHGDSDHPEELLVGAFNLDLEALLAELGTQDVVLVGHSMGAHVALDHAANHSAVRALVLIDPAREGGQRSRRLARLALSLRRSYATQDEAVARYQFVPRAEHVAEKLRRSIAEHSVEPTSDGRWTYRFDPRWFTVGSRPRPDPSAVLCPTLLIRGAESPLLTPEAAVTLVGELQNGRLVEIEGAGHHVLLDRPVELIDALRDFLADIA